MSHAAVRETLRFPRSIRHPPDPEVRPLTLRIRLLGPPQVEVDGRPLVVDTRKAIALLAYVAVVGRPVARESLAELLWPEADPDDGRGALRRTLSVLRGGLGGGWLEVDRRQVWLPADGVDVDVAAFRADVRDAAHVHEAGTACRSCRTRLGRAAERYRADFLEGFSLRDSAPWDEWQALEAEALRAELAGTLRRLVELEAAEGRLPDALAAGRRLVALDPLDEAAHRAVMAVHAAAGDRAAAIRQYRAVVAVLERELGVEPAPETRAVYQALIDDRSRTGGTVPPPAATASSTMPDDSALELLRAAAILGDEIDPDVAREAAGVREADAARAFDRLVRDGWLVEAAGQQHLRFRDEGRRSLVLKETGLARRRILHRRVAETLAARSGGSAADHRAMARVAEHLAAGGAASDAADMHRRAAEAAGRISAHEAVATNARAALAFGGPGRPALLELLGDAETLRGRYGEALSAYEEAASIVPAGEVARFEHRLGRLHVRRGALDLAELHLRAAEARLSDVPAVLRARVLADLSLVAVRRDQAGAAARLARESLREARATGDAETESQAENLLAMLARRAGRVDTARRHLRRSVERAGVAEHSGARIAALNHLALLERAVGNLEDALALTDEALRRCAILGDRHREAALRNNRADLLHALGRRGEAAEEQVRSVTAFAEIGERPGLEPEIWKLVEW